MDQMKGDPPPLPAITIRFGLSGAGVMANTSPLDRCWGPQISREPSLALSSGLWRELGLTINSIVKTWTPELELLWRFQVWDPLIMGTCQTDLTG